jgi:PAS domain S-box-containing protein
VSAEIEGVLRLLLVAQHEADRTAVRRALAHASVPVEVSEAVDAPAGVARARQEGTDFDCILLDLHLPGGGGAWALAEIRAAGVVAPVVMLIGEADAQTAVELFRAGATDSITRSAMDPERLWPRLRQAARIGRAEEEARRARRAAQESEALLRLVVDEAPALISYIDASYRYRWTNRRYADWFEVSLTGAQSLPVAEVLGEVAFAQIKPKLDRALAGESLRYEAELTYRNGTRWVEATYVPHVGPGGQVEGLVALVQDIGERKRHEEQNRRQAEFEQQLLGIVSHDLRNPISVISVSAAMLLRREDASPPVTKALARILASADRAARMVRDLLDFTQARLGGGIPIERRWVDLFEIARQIIDEVGTNFPEREARFEASGNGQGQWDPDRLGQMIGNLLTNALSYSPAGAPVLVRIQGEDDMVILDIHNEGPPIPADVLPVLFQPFKRGRDHQEAAQRSVGLGLYIVKHLVEAHGGRVEVESGPAAGTRFRVHLPRGRDPGAR